MSGQSKDLTVNVLGNDKLSPTLEATAGKGSTAASKISGAFSSMGGVIGGELGELSNKIGEMFEGLAEHGTSAGEKLSGIGVGVAAAGAALVGIGDKGKSATQQLDAAIADTGASAEESKGSIEELVKSGENLGIQASTTETALAGLVTKTGDTSTATKDLAVAQQVSIDKHIDLASAATMVYKATQGNAKALQQFGITMQSSKADQAALTTATKDHQTALTTLQTAQQKLADLEAVDHGKKTLTIADQIALRDAHTAVANAQNNVTVTTTKLATATANANSATSQQAGVLDQISGKIKGQASAAMDTWTGKLDVIKTKVLDQVDVFGQKYGPAITATGAGLTVAGQAVAGVSSLLGLFKTGSEEAAVATEALSAATDVQTASTEAAAVATGELDVAEGIALAPVLAIIAGVALLAGGLYELWEHCTGFRDGVKEIFAAVEGYFTSWFDAGETIFHGMEAGLDAVKGAVEATIHWVEANWPLLLAIITGPIGLATLFVIDHWTQIKNGVSDAVKWVETEFDSLVGDVTGLPGRFTAGAKELWGFVSSGFDAAKTAVETKIASLVTDVTGLPAKITAGLAGLWDGLGAGAKDVLNGVITVWNDTLGKISFTLPTWIPGLGGDKFGFPTIAKFAEGGIVTGPTLGLMGEAGEPEMNLPLSKAKEMGFVGNQGSGGDIHVHISGVFSNPEELARTVVSALEPYVASGGVININKGVR